jgi:hypothetical protein
MEVMMTLTREIADDLPSLAEDPRVVAADARVQAADADFAARKQAYEAAWREGVAHAEGTITQPSIGHRAWRLMEEAREAEQELKAAVRDHTKVIDAVRQELEPSARALLCRALVESVIPRLEALRAAVVDFDALRAVVAARTHVNADDIGIVAVSPPALAEFIRGLERRAAAG